MDLPPSDGNTCILVTVDRFSKACNLVSLKGLPSTMEKQRLCSIMCSNFGIPEDIVSNQGPQFISLEWKALINLLGMSLPPTDQWSNGAKPSTELIPFLLGYQLPLFPWSGEPSDIPSVNYCSWEEHQHLQQEDRSHTIQVNVRRTTTPTYPAEKVWLSTRNIHLKLPCWKLPDLLVPSPSSTKIWSCIHSNVFHSIEYILHSTFHC